MDKEVLFSQTALFQSSARPNFSCCSLSAGSLLEASDFLMASIVMKSATPVGFWTPLWDAIKASHSSHHKVAPLSAQNLLFLQSCAEDYQAASPDAETAVHVWASMPTLLGTAALAMHSHAVDYRRAACCQWVKLHQDMLKKHHPNPKLELMTLPIVPLSQWILDVLRRP